MDHETNYILGDDPDEWSHEVRTFREVLYHECLDGVDLIFRFQDERLKYDIVLQPGVALDDIMLAYENVQGLMVDPNDGDLIIQTQGGTLEDSRPVLWQGEDSDMFDGRFAVVGNGLVRIKSTLDLDPMMSTTIDPGLVYCTYLGGSGEDNVQASLVDEKGRVYVVGSTYSTDFPVLPGAYQAKLNGGVGSGRTDGFVALLDANGSRLIACTYIGGNYTDLFSDIHFYGHDQLVLIGYSNSSNFPTLGVPYKDSQEGYRDVCLVRMPRNLTTAYYGTFFGGSGYEGEAVSAVGDDGSVYICGNTTSADLDTTAGAYMEGPPSVDDDYSVFAMKFKPSLRELDYSTYLGGDRIDEFPQCDLSDSGSLIVAFDTMSRNLWTSSDAVQRSFGGGSYDVYIASLSPDGSHLVNATYWGGDEIEGNSGLLLDSQGRVYIAGSTTSSYFNTTSNAHRKARMGVQEWPDSFVSVLDTNLSHVYYSTLLGGGHSDLSMDLAISPDETVLAFVGVTVSDDIHMERGCFDDMLRGYPGIFLHTFDITSWNLTYSTYFGGSIDDRITSPANVLSMDDEGYIYLALQSKSADLPTTHRAFQAGLCQTEYNGAVIKLDPHLCSRAPAPDVKMQWDHMFVNLTWDLTPYESCRLKEVRIYKATDPTRPSAPEWTLPPDAVNKTDYDVPEYNVTYYYWVSMVDTKGEGYFAGPLPIKLIGPPVGAILLEASSGDGTVTLDWHGEVDWNGGKWLQYRLERWSGLDDRMTIAENLSQSQRQFVDDDITNLSLGTTFYYRLIASNDEMEGVNTTANVTVYKPPTEPRDLQFDANDSFVHFSWNAPPFCGRPIQGYILQRKETATDWTTIWLGEPPALWYTDTGVENGHVYDYRMRAYIQDADGEWAVVTGVKPFGPPSEPWGVHKDNSYGSIVIDWNAPNQTYLEPIKSYIIYWGTEPDGLNKTYPSLERFWVSTEHQLDTVYYFRLVAVNEHGEGNATGLFSVFTLEPPTVVLGLKADTGDRWIDLQWEAPEYDGGNSSLTYHIKRWTSEDPRRLDIGSTDRLSLRDGDVEGGVTYHYIVIAYNPIHSGPASDSVDLTFKSRPRRPTGLSVVQGTDRIEISWIPPEDNGGLTIDYYNVTRRIYGTGLLTTSSVGTATAYYDTDASANVTYEYWVTAFNPLGSSERSSIEIIKVNGTFTAPIDLTWSDGGGFVNLSWKPPRTVAFVEVLGYQIYKGSNLSTMKPLEGLVPDTKYEDRDVVLNEYFYYQVRLVTDIGIGPASNNVTAFLEPPEPIPGGEEPPYYLYLVILVILVLLAVLSFLYWRHQVSKQEAEAMERAVSEATTEPSGPTPPWALKAPSRASDTVKATTEGPEGILPYIVEEVLVVYRDGRLITSCARDECGTADADLMSGMLIAVQGLIQDGLESGGRLESIKYGENLISLVTGEHLVLAAVVYGRPDDQLQEDLGKTVSDIEGTYAGIIEEWTGDPSALTGLDDLVLPLIERTAYLTRDNVGDVLADQGVALLSAVDFYRGYVRLKLAAVNATYDTIVDSALEVHYDDDMLRLERVEPDSITIRGDRVSMGNIKPGERKTIALLFDPQICQSTHIDGHLSYYSTQGELRYVEMKRRTADVVCPVFFTRENANTAMLRKLMREKLHQSDLRIYRYPPDLPAEEVLTISKAALGSDEIQLVREYLTPSPTYEAEVWYYAETRVKRYQFVIRLGVVEDKGVVELFAASTAMEPITGLLADFRRELNRVLRERHAEDARMVLEQDARLRRAMERRPLRLESDEE